MKRFKNLISPFLRLCRSSMYLLIMQHRIKDRAHFEKLASRNDVPGLKDIWVCKFIITNVDTKHPKMFYMNTKKYEHHYQYFKKISGIQVTEQEFDAITYYSNTGRKNLAGSIVARDKFKDKDNQAGIYTIEYWPTDPVSFKFVKTSWDIITKTMHFARGHIYQYLGSQTQIDQFNTEKELYANDSIQMIDTDTLFKNLTFIPLNLGESYGMLRIMDMQDIPAPDDIVIFRSLPNDLSHVRGIITDVAQTPLSHVNLKAKQNHIPNAYIKNASSLKEFTALVGKPVHYKITPNGYEIREVSRKTVDENLEKASPLTTSVPEISFEHKRILPLLEIGMDKTSAFGAKASNMGELCSILPKEHAIAGHAIPFYFYDCFMKENDFYKVVEEMIAKNDLTGDIKVIDKQLEDVRTLIQSGSIPVWMTEEFTLMQAQYPLGADIRLRSSSNSEDLENFNGAGLYSSMVYLFSDGPIEETIKKVWASLWTLRAFTEREFHKIEHRSIAMGILVHIDHKMEQHNGVVVTKNLFNSIWNGYYINVQTGQSLVTNPDLDALPDELLVSEVGANRELEIQYVRRSNLVSPNEHVMQDSQVWELVIQSQIIHNHFKKCYNAQDDREFAMEIEFLTTTDGVLKIMQARPWLD